ncbi:plastocyanin/azurin family copper-binding protein [Haloarchaeobius sp. HRN-SO-5]|uniref:plastocyanin/azurin family copper-binding protein n=1 Tax=Haloarchaeobius sp. HRN-SO-5 TaxID=3446118 RepID=UPI003EBD874F
MVGSLAGCLGASSSGDIDTQPSTSTATASATEAQQSSVTEVAVGPERRLRFEPESIEISVGDTVRWTAESPGHNVTSKPGSSGKCENPDGADPFASYDGGNHYAVMEVDATFEHTFTVAGTYVYVCAPHAGQGMVGDITVSE